MRISKYIKFCGATYRQVDYDDIIGYDLSEDTYDLHVRCDACSDKLGDGGGSPIYKGDDWGGYDYPVCDDCGEELTQVNLVSPSLRWATNPKEKAHA